MTWRYFNETSIMYDVHKSVVKRANGYFGAHPNTVHKGHAFNSSGDSSQLGKYLLWNTIVSPAVNIFEEYKLCRYSHPAVRWQNQFRFLRFFYVFDGNNW